VLCEMKVSIATWNLQGCGISKANSIAEQFAESVKTYDIIALQEVGTNLSDELSCDTILSKIMNQLGNKFSLASTQDLIGQGYGGCEYLPIIYNNQRFKSEAICMYKIETDFGGQDIVDLVWSYLLTLYKTQKKLYSEVLYNYYKDQDQKIRYVGGRPRKVVFYRMESTNGDVIFDLVNVHLASNQKHAKKQLDVLLGDSFLTINEYPVIIAGDLNQRGLVLEKTSTKILGSSHLDYILLQPNNLFPTKMLRSGVVNCPVLPGVPLEPYSTKDGCQWSDHKLLYAIVELR